MKKIFLILTVMATLVSCGGNSTDATVEATTEATSNATTEATSNATTSDSTSVEATSKVEKK
jgi:hypothetical protein